MVFKADRQYDCLILGGGPAGLSMGYRLSRLSGIDYVILERGELGHSWGCMHDSLLLLSPMWVNQLPGHRFPLSRSFEKIPKVDFIQYLVSYAQRYSMNWAPNVEVTSVAKENDVFVASTSKGEIRSRTIVNATGYYSRPYTPEFETNDGSITMIHSAEYKSPAELAKLIGCGDKKILIVGKRVSAGQLLEELDDAGHLLGISTQAAIETRVGGILGIIKENLYYLKEMLRFLFDPYIKQNSLALMNGGKTDKIIESGRLKHHTAIKRIQDGQVAFSDGERETYDLIICATGYVSGYPHLCGLIDARVSIREQLNMGEHLGTPGLFFLGVDNMINFKSRYVRGVAADSKIISEKLLQHLNRSRQQC